MENMNSKDNTISIIPKPIKVDIKLHHFTLTKNTAILTNPDLLKQAEFLKNLIESNINKIEKSLIDYEF